MMDTRQPISKRAFIAEIVRIVYLCEHEDRDGAKHLYEELEEQLEGTDFLESDGDIRSLFLETEFMLYEETTTPDEVKTALRSLMHPKG